MFSTLPRALRYCGAVALVGATTTTIAYISRCNWKDTANRLRHYWKGEAKLLQQKLKYEERNTIELKKKVEELQMELDKYQKNAVAENFGRSGKQIAGVVYSAPNHPYHQAEN